MMMMSSSWDAGGRETIVTAAGAALSSDRMWTNEKVAAPRK